MKLNQIRDNPGAHRPRKVLGRGIGSGLGKQAGRGTKGQKARSGVALAGFEGGQMPLYRRLPKRGFHNPFRRQFAELNLGTLQAAIDAGRVKAGETLTEDMLCAAGLIRRRRDGVRLLGDGEVKAAITIAVTCASKAAIPAIEKAGGKVVLPEAKPAPKGKGKRRHLPKAYKPEGAPRERDRKAAEAEAKAKAKKEKPKGEGKPEGKAAPAPEAKAGGKPEAQAQKKTEGAPQKQKDAKPKDEKPKDKKQPEKKS